MQAGVIVECHCQWVACRYECRNVMLIEMLAISYGDQNSVGTVFTEQRREQHIAGRRTYTKHFAYRVKLRGVDHLLQRQALPGLNLR